MRETSHDHRCFLTSTGIFGAAVASFYRLLLLKSNFFIVTFNIIDTINMSLSDIDLLLIWETVDSKSLRNNDWNHKVFRNDYNGAWFPMCNLYIIFEYIYIYIYTFIYIYIYINIHIYILILQLSVFSYYFGNYGCFLWLIAFLVNILKSCTPSSALLEKKFFWDYWNFRKGIDCQFFCT